MYDEYTIIIEWEGGWYVARCLEVPSARGRGRTKQACIDSIAERIELIVRRRHPPGLPKPSLN